MSDNTLTAMIPCPEHGTYEATEVDCEGCEERADWHERTGPGESTHKCPGGREIVLHLDAIRSALRAASESLIEPERYRVWYKEALAALEVSGDE